MQGVFARHTSELREVLGKLDGFHKQISAVVQQLREAFVAGRTVYVAGNGGSATQAQHLSDELVGRYRGNRRPYPVVALTADTAVLTCIGNDFGFDEVFKRQIEALGREGDVFVALSTSGNSRNVLSAAEQARAQGMTVIALTGPRGTLKGMADYAIVAPAETGARIQELHLHAIHLICEAFEEVS